MDTFEPGDLRDAFDSIRASINERLAANAGRIVVPPSVSIHMDYIDSEVSNALAFSCSGVHFIGVTAGMLRHFVKTCSALWRSKPLGDLFGIVLNQPNQDFLFQTLLLLQIQFIADHELGHMFHGHCADIYQGIPYLEFAAGYSVQQAISKRMKEQAHEVEADGYAVEMMLHGIFRDSVGNFICERLKPTIAEGEFLILLYILAIAALLYWMPATTFDPNAIRNSDHPIGIARMNVIMRDILRWCSENRVDLLPFVSLDRFQWVMACIQVAAESENQQAAWLAQGTFLRSELGQAYVEELYQAREVLRKEMEPTRWRLAG